MWIDRKVVDDLRADKVQLRLDLERERSARTAQVLALENEKAVLVGDLHKLRHELERVRMVVQAEGNSGKLRRYGLTAQAAREVDWVRLGTTPPAEVE